jgi:hypothetical protein
MLPARAENKLRLSDLRMLLAVLALSLAAATPMPDIRVVNESALTPQDVDALLAGYRRWAERLFAYLQARDVAPITLVLTPRAHVGLYLDDRILMPPDDDRGEMEETWIHELTHHVTGHDSTYFFKEGIASHALEKLYAEEQRVPQGWPQYGANNDDWVRLFAARGELMPLARAMAWNGYDGSTAEQDYRSWQVYAIAASFAGWYVARYGMAEFLEAFRAGRTSRDVALLEREWRAALDHRTAPLPDPHTLLPERERYRYFASRLRPPTVAPSTTGR